MIETIRHYGRYPLDMDLLVPDPTLAAQPA